MNKKSISLNIIIILIIISIVLFVWLFFNNDWKFNYESYYRFKAEYLTSKEKCDKLTLEDTKKLNEWFKEINYSWWIDYWCNLKSLHFSDLNNSYKWKKLKDIQIPSEIWKLNNLYEINLIKVNIVWWIPKEIWELQNLVILDLNWTWIEKLPKEIENLNKLRILYIDKYLYNSLPEIIKEKINNNKIIDYSYYIEDYYN